MLNLKLYRAWKTEKSTIGILSCAAKYFCFSLEDKVREPFIKIPKMTAIPPGRYDIELKVSPNTGLLTPWLINVPHFENIQIHIANYPNQVEGCIAVGINRGDDMVLRSKVAFDILMAEMKKYKAWDIHIFKLYEKSYNISLE